MQFTRIILSIVFVLFASTTLEAKSEKSEKSEKSAKSEKSEKILVCHVGHTRGPDGGTLKVDLISVSTNAKHIGNAKHSFEESDGFIWYDYAPEDGVGDEAADFEEGGVAGIDRGCELEQDLTCPCLTGYTETSLVTLFESQLSSRTFICTVDTRDERAYLVKSDYPATNTFAEIDVGSIGGGYCTFRTWDFDIRRSGLDAAASHACFAETVAVISRITGCP